jgi:hypothetical protein
MLFSCASNVKPLEDYTCEYFMKISQELINQPENFESILSKYDIERIGLASRFSDTEIIKDLEYLKNKNYYPLKCYIKVFKNAFDQKKLKVSVVLVYNGDFPNKKYGNSRGEKFMFEKLENENLGFVGLNYGQL